MLALCQNRAQHHMVMYGCGIGLQSVRMCAGDGKTGILGSSMAMVYECGPWTGCEHGLNCPQAVTQRVGSPARFMSLITACRQPTWTLNLRGP